MLRGGSTGSDFGVGGMMGQTALIERRLTVHRAEYERGQERQRVSNVVRQSAASLVDAASTKTRLKQANPGLQCM